MALIQCKMCGGELKLPEGVTQGECPYCGSLTTFPKLADSQAEQFYNRAEQFRRNNDFDRAEQAYGQYIQASPEDPEGYWGLVLSRFGIEYVEDPATHERLPTCHRVQYDPITKDPDYLRAVELASGYDRDLYEKEAQRIEEIQQGILAISAQEKPYDVFICYKETTDGGTRTRDSVDAQEIYYQLTDQGYKVFFSRITLEGKLGAQYEPYIFAALNSAKVMLVIGSRKEFFEAVWVKNEWSRFLALMKKDRSKLVIPCYRDMTAYDLPRELSMFQAQDMSKIGFIQDLLHGVKKVAGREEGSGAQVSAGDNAVNVNNLLRRTRLFIETGNFESALEYCEKILDQDAESGDAYWYRLMAEMQSPDEKTLSERLFRMAMDNKLESCTSFKLAQRFAKGDLAARIDEITKHIDEEKDKREKARLRKQKEEEEARLRKQKEEEEARLRKQKEEEEARLRKQKEEEEARLRRQQREEARRREEEERRRKKQLAMAAREEAFKRNCKKWGPIAAGVLAAAAAVAYLIITADLSASRVSAEIKACGMSRLLKDREFPYYGASVKDVVLTKAEDKARTYSGTVVLELSGSVFRRPVNVSYTKNNGRIEFNYDIAIDYSQHPEFLKEDAVLFFARLKKEDEWKDWNFVSADNLSPGVLRLIVKNSADKWEETEIRIENKNGRFVSRILNGRGGAGWLCGQGVNFAGKGESVKAARYFRKAAEQGHAEAQYRLGECYAQGRGVARNYNEAVKWYRKAAEQGYAPAQNTLGGCYYFGRGVEKDYNEAVKWFRKAAEQGNAVAKTRLNFAELILAAERGNAETQFRLGKRYEEGKGVARDLAEAVKWYRKAAQQGNSDAQNNLGYCYENGQGVEKDYNEAVKWYRKAAEQGNSDAQNKLGECYGYGRGVEKDYNEAVKWYRKAAEQGNAVAKTRLNFAELILAAERGNAETQFRLGKRYEEGKGVARDLAEAVKWYRKAAEQGYAPAQNTLGGCYYFGRGVEKDYNEAVKWYREAAEQGNSDAQNNLGLCYANGQGVEKDYNEAVKWYRKAAEQGNANAQFNLGVCYEYVEKDYNEAVKWYRKAAEQGNAYAQNNLGDCYHKGRGVEKDYNEAVKWYRKAAKQGDADAQDNLGRCYENGQGVEKDYNEAVKWYRKAAEQGYVPAQNALRRMRRSR